jgi:hypothetical protein
LKNIGLFILLVLVLTACVPNAKTVEFAQAKTTFESVRSGQLAAQGTDVIENIQTLMLVLLGLFLLVPAFLASYIIIRILVLWRHKTQRIDFGQWVDESDDSGKVSDGNDIGQQMQIDQQWLFSLMLSQDHEEAASHDLFEPPMDWLE